MSELVFKVPPTAAVIWRWGCRRGQFLDEKHTHTFYLIIPPANFVCGGYTVFTLSVRASVRLSVRNVLFP